jgi:large subunit ribosomal protein L29
MKISEITGMSDEQLSLTLKDTERHLFQLRFQSATDRLETPSEIRKAKRDIARIKTTQRTRELTKLVALPDAELAKQVDAIQPKTEGPGKRRAKRALARVQAIQADRATPKKGSGK